MARKSKRGPSVQQTPPDKASDRWSRAIGGVVLCVLSGAAAWLVAPYGPYGAALLVGLLAGALIEDGRPWLGAVVAFSSAVLVIVMAATTSVRPAPTTAVLVLFPLIATIVALGVGMLVAGRVKREHVAYVLLAMIALTFVVRSEAILQSAGQRYLIEPPAEQYQFDPILFEKTFYLMEGGSGFYDAYGDAFVQDARFDKPQTDLAGWRSPTAFWFWTIIADRWATVAWAFVVLATLTFAGSYYIAWRAFGNPIAAVVPAILLVPYYTFALARGWFPELEFWAAFFAIASAVALHAKRERLAIALALPAAAMREWLLSALLAGGASRLASKKPVHALYWGVSAGAVVAGYVANAWIVRRYLVSVGVAPQLGTTGRVGGGGPGFILYTARFCADFTANPYALPWLIMGIALAVAVVLLWRRTHTYLAAMFLLPLAAFMVFGSSQGPFGETGWNDYYGAVYLPFAFVLAAGAAHPLGLFFAQKRGKDSGKASVRAAA